MCQQDGSRLERAIDESGGINLGFEGNGRVGSRTGTNWNASLKGKRMQQHSLCGNYWRGMGGLVVEPKRTGTNH